ncbi:MAG: YvcK family protein [Candidatus Wallbacteria bacterium]|nr:YvcK family protein [Candidatus Wallbacteria bacterium]
MNPRFWKKLHWLLPNIELRRWLLLLLMSAVLLSSETTLFLSKKLSLFLYIVSLFPTAALFAYSYYRVIRFVYSEFQVVESGEVAKFYPSRHFDVNPRLVVIGGGTGLATLLRGIKKYARLYDEQNVSAVVSVMDDGGSSGRLRNELNILPPGDIRNCLVSLAREETMMAELFKYRFQGEGELGGHSFGNLFIAALTAITGDFERAVEESTKILAVKGSILPATLSSHALVAEKNDGSIVKGESDISATPGKEIKRIFLDPPGANVNRKVLQAISEADCIIFGPGSLFTSVIPNLLVREIRETLKESHALKIYICNIMTQPHETDGFTASDHLRVILENLNGARLDYVVINSRKGSPEMLARYAQRGSYPVEVDLDQLNRLDTRIVLGELMAEADYLRHNFKNLSRLIVNLIVNRMYGKK